MARAVGSCPHPKELMCSMPHSLCCFTPESGFIGGSTGRVPVSQFAVALVLRSSSPLGLVGNFGGADISLQFQGKPRRKSHGFLYADTPGCMSAARPDRFAIGIIRAVANSHRSQCSPGTSRLAIDQYEPAGPRATAGPALLSFVADPALSAATGRILVLRAKRSVPVVCRALRGQTGGSSSDVTSMCGFDPSCPPVPMRPLSFQLVISARRTICAPQCRAAAASDRRLCSTVPMFTRLEHRGRQSRFVFVVVSGAEAVLRRARRDARGAAEALRVPYSPRRRGGATHRRVVDFRLALSRRTGARRPR